MGWAGGRLRRAIAMVGLLLAVAGPPAFAQQSDKPSESAAGTPSSDQLKPRNRLLIDVIKTVVPPLIDAATSKPKPQPAEQPAAIEPATVTAPDPEVPAVAEPPPPLPASNETAVTPASLPQAAPMAASPPAAPPRDRAPDPQQPPLAASPAPVAPPLVQPSAPLALELKPPLEPALATAAPIARPVGEALPPTEPDGSSWIWGFLLALAVLIATAAGYGIDRARRITRTRNLLSLAPRLEFPAGQGTSNGLSIAGPGISIRARLQG